MSEVEILPPARRELEEAFAYYESQKEGLGLEFSIEVWRTFARIRE